jgi:hypothetical protein
LMGTFKSSRINRRFPERSRLVILRIFMSLPALALRALSGLSTRR